MHFTTRCPACGTMFRVVPDQLKISEGWVRCGHCADVFDATLYLETWKPPAASVDGESKPTSETTAKAAYVRSPGLSAGSALSGPAAAPPAAQRRAENLEDTATAGMPAKPAQTHPQREPLQTQARKDAAEQAADAHVPVGVEGILASAAGVVPHPVLQASEPSFVQQARRRAFWHSPGMRPLLSVVALLCTLALGLQIVLHERDALAARQPRWAPALKQLCVPLGCEVAAVRRIDAIVIDSSTLVRRLGNFHSFDVVLQNTASVPLAVPALELSLTDTRDAVIARRVFLPEELPGAPALLPAKNAVSISLRLSLAVGESMPMAGYRALVFYP